MKHVSVVLAALLLGVGVLVGIVSLGAQSASAAPEGGFDVAQTAAFAEGTTEKGTDFVLELDRTVKPRLQNPGSGVGWGISLELDGEEEFDAEVPPASFNINFNTGRATVNTEVDGCRLKVEWEALGQEFFRSDNTFTDEESEVSPEKGEVRFVLSVKSADVSGKVCGEKIDEDEDTAAQLTLETRYCRGFSDDRCKDFKNDGVPSEPEA